MAKKKKIRLELEVKSSPSILYSYISTPSGLSQWFANDVDVHNDVYKFKWDGQETEAQLLKKTPNKSIRFKWLDSADDEYFEFEIVQDELTEDVAFVIVDFVEAKDEEEAKLLWESQVHDLRSSLGG